MADIREIGSSSRYNPVGLEEANCHVVEATWQGTEGALWELRTSVLQPQEIELYQQFYKLSRGPPGSYETQPWQTPCFQPGETLSRRAPQPVPGHLTHRNCEIIDLHCSKPFNLWRLMMRLYS